MGQHFLDAAYKRSDSCLDAVAGAADKLGRELDTCRVHLGLRQTGFARSGRGGGLRLEEWVQTLDETAEKLKVKTAFASRQSDPA